MIVVEEYTPPRTIRGLLVLLSVPGTNTLTVREQKTLPSKLDVVSVFQILGNYPSTLSRWIQPNFRLRSKYWMNNLFYKKWSKPLRVTHRVTHDSLLLLWWSYHRNHYFDERSLKRWNKLFQQQLFSSVKKTLSNLPPYREWMALLP